MTGRQGGPVRVVVPVAVTVGIVGGLLILTKTGIFDHMGKVGTACVVGADLFVLALVWVRALR
jgi:hypothetical protein